MIIKGGSRGNARWLGAHLTRADTNERIEVMELHTLHDDALSSRDRLTETFRDWQILTAGTQGRDGLYHANIDPAIGYDMTAEQWNRAVNVLEEELGLQGQPRAVVLHEKHGRTHLHVVWSRTDLDTMTLRSDSYNYHAHERASKRLELEFGHEPVPGKHAKRDREKQPEFPRSELTQADLQQGERGGYDPRARKAELAALFERSDTSQAFRAALRDAGYILAKGDKRNLVVIDDSGKVHALGKRLTGKTPAELGAFMADVDLDGLPSVKAARAEQATRAKAADPVPESAKPATSSEAPAHTKPESAPAEKPVEAPEAKPKPTPEELWERRIARALTERHAFEAAEIRQRHTHELRQLRKVSREEISERIADIRALQQAERDRWWREDKEQRSGIWGFINAMQSRLNPVAALEKAQARQKAIADMAARQKQERADMIAMLRQSRAHDIDDLKDRHAQQRRDHGAQYDVELARYIREERAARELVKQTEEARRQREAEQGERERQGRGPPRAG